MSPKESTMSNIPKTMSDAALCQTKMEPVEEKLFTTGLLNPLFFLVAYLWLLKYMWDDLERDVMQYPNTTPYQDYDPFKRVWWSGPIFFTILYLFVVKFGQEFMKNRDVYQIEQYKLVYNSYQCIHNLLIVVAFIYEIYTDSHYVAPWGNKPQTIRQGFYIGRLVWVHYNNKYVELLDTLWMILKKKDKQISVLHCYHHVLLIWAWFFVCKIEAGGDCYFGATVNSFIHVIMYAYYTSAMLKIPCPWKRWITNCQMIQFMACLCHSIYVVIKGNMPIALPLVQAFVMINMLILFGQFYRESYLKKGSTKSSKKE